MTPSNGRRVGALATAVLLAAGLAACGGLDGGSDSAEFDEQAGQQERTEGGKEESGQAGEASGADAQEEARSEPQEVSFDPAEAIQTTTYPLATGRISDEEATITAALHTVRVEGETMVVQATFTPEFADDHQVDLYNLHGTSFSPALNDRENLKRYRVLGSGPGEPGWATSTSPGGPSVSAGGTLLWQGHFAAPEDEIETITVTLVPGLVEFDDVPIER